MGLMKKLKIRPPPEDSVEENRQNMQQMGMPVKDTRKKLSRFASYKKYADDQLSDEPRSKHHFSGLSNKLKRSGTRSFSNESVNSNSNSNINNNPYSNYSIGNENSLYTIPTNSTRMNDSSNMSVMGFPQNGYSGDNYSSLTDNLNQLSSNATINDNNNNRRSSHPSYQYSSTQSNYRQNSILNTTTANNNTLQEDSRYWDNLYQKNDDNHTLNYNDSPFAIDNNQEYDNDEDSLLDFFSSNNLQQVMKFETNAQQDTSTIYNNNVAIDEDLNQTVNLEDKFSSNANTSAPPKQQQQLHANEYSDLGYQRQESKGFKSFSDIQKEEEDKAKQEEEEEVDQIKKEIKFTRQKSVASTRNTLQMARDAERSGLHSLGMLGEQSEILYNVEDNLELMKQHNVIASDNTSHLQKLNRSVFAIHVGNPFNSKTRALAKAEKIKERQMQERLDKKEAGDEFLESMQRIENGMKNNNQTDISKKYQRAKILERNKKYQFENDEEDDEMEVEIDQNLDEIGKINRRLRRIALAASEELDSQQVRLNKIENNTERVDIDIQMNTERLELIS